MASRGIEASGIRTADAYLPVKDEPGQGIISEASRQPLTPEQSAASFQFMFGFG